MADHDEKQGRISRRKLLISSGATAGVAGAAAAGLDGCGWARVGYELLMPNPEHEGPAPAAWAESKVSSYRPFGNTGFAMSDISFGCGGLDNPDVVRRALDKGINYFDTAPDYSHTASERSLGEGIRGTDRDKIFIASKFCSPDGHLDKDMPTDEIVQSVENSLQRIGVDYLDVILIHAVNSIDRLMAPTFHEAFDRLRDAGKVRYLGVSSHTPDLEKVMRKAVESKRFNMMMVAYNFSHWPQLRQIFADAKQSGMGVVAMKTLKGAYHTQLSDFTPTERETFSQAAFKWVLSNQDVSGLVVTMRKFEQLDEYLYASGQPMTDSDVALLERYDELTTNHYCRPGCGECLDSCPVSVPIDDILRYQMYARSYGQEKIAMTDYARVPEHHNASQCASCPAPCEAACPYELPIRNRMVQAHRDLKLA